MSSTISANFTDSGAAIIALQTLANGAVARGTLDLRSKRGAWIFVAVGRQGTTAPANPIAVCIRRLMNAGAIEQPTAPNFQGDVTAALQTTFAASGNNAGSTSITVASTTSFAAGDLIFMDDTGNAGLANSEWGRVSKVTSGAVLQLDAPTQYAHNSTSAHVSNHADIWPPVWVDGGCYVEVVIDYGASGTGSTCAVRAYVSTYDSDNAT